MRLWEEPKTRRYSSIKEFSKFKTQAGCVGFQILVDHYKDRLAAVLRREWIEEMGDQPMYHFNAPIDLPDNVLKELTVETRREKTDANGNVSYEWYRPGNARNELWDLLVYGNCAVEIIANNFCIEMGYQPQELGQDQVNWVWFWQTLDSHGHEEPYNMYKLLKE